MTARAVIDVDIPLEKAKRFGELFDKYHEQLAKQPNVWKNVGKEQAAMASQFERMTAAMMAQSAQATEELAARAEENKRLNDTHNIWDKISSSTNKVKKNVLDTTVSLLKWTGILTGIGGLLGGGALFGLDKLAAGLGNERRNAMGLGMSVGGYRAFNLDFSRALDTDKFLGDVQEMMTNPGAAGPLWRMGVNPNGKTEDVAKSYMDRLRTLAVATPTSRIGLLNQQYGTNLSTPEWMRLHEMSADEYGDMRNAATKDKKKFDVPDATARKWQEFGIQLDRAGMQIKNVFEIQLAKLVDPMTRASEKAVAVAEALAKGPLIGEIVKQVGDALDWLGKEVASKDFQQDIISFEKSVASLASAAGSLATWLLGSRSDANNESRVGHAARWAVGSDKDKTGKPVDHMFWGPDANEGFLGAGKAAEAIRNWFTGEDDRSGEQKMGPVIGDMSSDSGIDLSTIVGDHPTSWNPAPISNSYAANRSSVSNTTNNYGGRGGGSVSINIMAPPGFSANTTLAGLNAGLV